MALGASKWKTIATVIVPAAYRGILTAVLLAFARVAGETAPLLFTALGNRFWSPLEPADASLPEMILDMRFAPYEDWNRQAWGRAWLLGLILVINIIAGRFWLAHCVRGRNMHASVSAAVSLNITPTQSGAIGRESVAALAMRMNVSKVNFFYGPKQVLFDVNLGWRRARLRR